MEEELPLRLIELSDFLHFPSIFSKELELKKGQTEQLPSDLRLKDVEKSDEADCRDNTKMGVVLLKQKILGSDNYSDEQPSKTGNLSVSKNVIIFADDLDRKKIGLVHKPKNCFSRHLLITSGAALQALIPTLTNAKEWIIVCQLQYARLHTKKSPIERNVLVALNLRHPMVRYEILTAFDLLQQSFNEIKSAFILIDFSQLLSRWFKNHLQRTDQYPSLSRRFWYRHQIQTCKCSITLGKRTYCLDKSSGGFKNNFQKLHRKSNVPMHIHINFNALPTMVYSIELNNIFIYSMNDEYKKIIKDIGNGLSLVSVQNLASSEDLATKTNDNASLIPKEETFQGKYSVQEQEETHVVPMSYEPSEQEKALFAKVWNNRMRIQMQHRQLMMKAVHLLGFSSINNDSLYKTNIESNKEPNLQTMTFLPF